MKIFITYIILLFFLCLNCMGVNGHKTQNSAMLDTATFGAGCFWCTEAVFQRLKGVEKVVSGYSGGQLDNPSYKDVTQGNTGYAEVCQIYFNPSKISYSELLEVFWKTHDPTTLNKQGNDEGEQYRSVVFYHNDKQKEQAKHYKLKLEEAKIYPKPIVTAIEPYIKFYSAEDYHQNYYNNNSTQPYCKYVIVPKLEKFEKIFKHKMKSSK